MKIQKKLLNVSISMLLCFVLLIQTVSAAGLFHSLSVSANAFDIVFAIDNSINLYNYDYSAGNTWLEAFYGAMDQAPSGSRFSVLSHDNETELTNISPAESALYEIPLYSGTADPVGLLHAAENILRSGNNQKMVVLSSAICYNNSELKNKIDELSNKDILIYLIAFEKDSEKTESIKDVYENVIVCSDAKELPIRMAELYEYLVTMPQAYSLAAANSTSEIYNSSFRDKKHNYSIYQNPNQGGSYLAQLLNMYYLLPTYTDGYGPLDYGACIEASRGNTNKMFQTSFPAGFLDFWNDLADRLLSDSYFSVSSTSGNGLSTVIKEKIKKNLMQRYPVLIEADDTYYLITSMNDGNYCVDGGSTPIVLENKDIRMLDTALYMQACLGTPGVMSEMEISGNRATVAVTLPEASDIFYMYGNEENKKKNTDGITISASCEELIVSVRTDFTDVLPRFHRSNLYYYIKIFTDVTPNLWCKEYIFDMVNRGIISGYEEKDGLYFRYKNNITIAEFLVMLIKAADITIDTTIGEGETWAYPYLDYAGAQDWWPEMTKDNTETIIYEFKNDHDYSDDYNPDDPEDGNYGGIIPTYTSFEALKSEDKHLPKLNGVTLHGYDNPITREFAFYLLWTVATSEECNTPNHLVKYPNSDFSNRFEDYSQGVNPIFKEAVDNLINNNAVAGDTEGKLNPKKWITRGEMCRLFSYAMFSFDKDNNFKYPEIVNNIKTITLEETGETIKSGTTNEYGEGIYTFTIASGKTGLYPPKTLTAVLK